MDDKDAVLSNDLQNNNSNIDLVIRLSKQIYPDNPIVRELMICQAVLESNLLHSPSQLAYKYNNLFGIKGIGTGLIIDGKKKESVNLPTHEYYDGRGVVIVDQYFAVNNSLMDSLLQYKELLEHDRYKLVMESETFSEAALRIFTCGYATDNRYPQELMKIQFIIDHRA